LDTDLTYRSSTGFYIEVDLISTGVYKDKIVLVGVSDTINRRTFGSSTVVLVAGGIINAARIWLNSALSGGADTISPLRI
jgi:hypothetical protein